MPVGFEKICTGSSSVLTFPKNGQQTEMLRVTDQGQVLFNYRVWDVGSATDLYFRALAAEAPELCKAVLPEFSDKLKACETSRADFEKQTDFWKTNHQLLMHTNENLSRTTSGTGALLWLAAGVYIGAFVTAWVFNRVRG